MFGFFKRKQEPQPQPQPEETGAVLVDLRNINGEIIFTFERNEEFFTIETVSTWSSDVSAWRKLAGLD